MKMIYAFHMSTSKISSGSLVQPWSNLRDILYLQTGVLFKGIMKKHDSLE